MSVFTLVITFLGSLLKSERQLRLENLALRQQVAMLQQSVKRPRVSAVDKIFWILFSRIEEVISAPRSPWQNPYVERVIGSIRRDCLDHVIVFNERHLRRILRDYFNYYHACRTHLSLNKDSPKPRAVEPESLGNIVALPQVGGLHHRYTRAAA